MQQFPIRAFRPAHAARPARHSRLFELIRQDRLLEVEREAADLNAPGDVTPEVAEAFIAAALRSFERPVIPHRENRSRPRTFRNYLPEMQAV